DGALIGWVSGYLLPNAPDTLFIWQIAIDPSAQNMGIGKQLLKALLQRPSCSHVRTLKTTITSDNRASWALFESLARNNGTTLTHTPHYLADAHFDGPHATEHLVTVPLSARETKDVKTPRLATLTHLQDRKTKTSSAVPTYDPQIFTRRESEARSYCRSFPTVFTKGQGAMLTDTHGRSYIDFLAGCSTLNYGHNDPDMKAALIEHLSRDGVTHGLDMHTDAKAAFLDTFERLILRPRNMDY